MKAFFASPLQTMTICILVNAICITLSNYRIFSSIHTDVLKYQHHIDGPIGVQSLKVIDEPIDVQNRVGVFNEGFDESIDSEQFFDLDNIPNFFKDYFEWHRQQIKELNNDRANAKTEEDDAYLLDYKFLVIRCIPDPNPFHQGWKYPCGGISDRIRWIPSFLWMAASTNRILLIRWTIPAPIETFMMPVYWNWTVPDDVYRRINKLNDAAGMVNNTGLVMDKWLKNVTEANGFSRLMLDKQINFTEFEREVNKQNQWMVEGNVMRGGWFRGGFNYLPDTVNSARENVSVIDPLVRKAHPDRFSNIQPSDADWKRYYHDLFHATFRPSPGVQAALDDYFYDPANNKNASATRYRLPLPLKRNEYLVSHYRTKFVKGGADSFTKDREERMQGDAKHAVECAKIRDPSTPSVFFLTDNNAAQKTAKSLYGDPTTSFVQSPLDLVDGNGKPMEEKVILNLDEEIQEDVTLYYPTFVDMFVMSHAKCVVHGTAGFGMLGKLFSNNVECGARYQKSYYDKEHVNCSKFEEMDDRG